MSLVTSPVRDPRAFDLNIEKVLEHWPVPFALREFIANALDEQMITGTGDPSIVTGADGRWHIRDFGRGLSYEHLTQKESQEKRKHPLVIGQFGIGLKDALAVCYRRNVSVELRSRHGDITVAMRSKSEGFSDVVTLHALVSAPSAPEMVGTDIVLSGVTGKDVAVAKSFFLRYSGDEELEATKLGDVLAKSNKNAPGRIYVKGLLVAEEPNFLFSYNVTKPNAALKRALNRERSNVGRTAYSERVKEILKESQSPDVAGPLADDLSRVSMGRSHDEIAWKDVAVHACRVLQSREKVIFITAWQTNLATVQYAEGDGYRAVIVPDDIAFALRRQTDLDGRPMVDLGHYQQEWNDSFSFEFIDPANLDPNERAVFDLTDAAVSLARVNRKRRRVDEILISETMRLSTDGSSQVLGVWEEDNKRIVIRRDQLTSATLYLGTLLHELSHAASGEVDGTLEFEDALTKQMGGVAARVLIPPKGRKR